MLFLLHNKPERAWFEKAWKATGRKPRLEVAGMGCCLRFKKLDDLALDVVADLSVRTQYPQLLLGEEIWLPSSSPSVFKSVDAAGNERMFGNCGKLLNELDQLNDRTWRADTATRDLWGREGLDQSAVLEAAAKFGWSLMHRLASEAVRHKLPIILDY
jgi:hypothetical protein